MIKFMELLAIAISFVVGIALSLLPLWIVVNLYVLVCYALGIDGAYAFGLARMFIKVGF